MAHADAPEDGRAFEGSASGSDNEESPYRGADDGGKSKGLIRTSTLGYQNTSTAQTAVTSFKDKNNNTVQQRQSEDGEDSLKMKSRNGSRPRMDSEYFKHGFGKSGSVDRHGSGLDVQVM